MRHVGWDHLSNMTDRVSINYPKREDVSLATDTGSTDVASEYQ